MIRKGLIYLTTTLTILLLVGLAIAVVPPPPVEQNLGLYDTVFTGFTTDECKECHAGDNVDRHHLLVLEGKKCMDCHGINDGEIRDFRNCSDCHLSSPHHATPDAQEYRCSECHGSLVDDYNDGHEIPTYPMSLITPDTSYKYLNSATGLKIGGCEACHEPDSSAVPAIESNPNTHHSLVGFTDDNCDLCHVNGGVSLDIRLCERCHGIKSLHSIQYDYDNTVGSLGYGHIGDNWDCWGCHGWEEVDMSDASSLKETLAGSSISFTQIPEGLSGATIPYIDYIDPSEIPAGQDTTITIYGSNFINTYNGVTYTSVVVLDNGLEIDQLESITATEIVVTIPGTLEPGNYGLWVVKDGNVFSNKVKLMVSFDTFVTVSRK